MQDDFEAAKAFTLELGFTFIKLYGLFVDNGRMTFTQAQREFQLYRRGRYVEFNLIYDRGTKFGLMSGGRIESILVSLPATVHFVYDYTPGEGTREGYLYAHFLRAQPWLRMSHEELQEFRSPYSYLTVKAAAMQVSVVSEADTQRAGGQEVGEFGVVTKTTAAVAALVAVTGMLKYLRA
jgi:coproporphyrinogen III oxidase